MLNALQDPLQRLELALSYANLGDWSWDPHTDVVQLSPQAAELCRIPGRETISWAELSGHFHPGDREQARQAVAAAVLGRTHYDIEYRLASTPLRWISARGRGIYDEAGQILGMIGVVQDVTARKTSEARLRESEERFRRMADDAPVMLWVTEPDGYCSYLNRRWCEFTGSAPEDGLGAGWVSRIHQDDRERVAVEFLNANRNRSPINFEYRLCRHDGVWRVVNDSAVPRFGSDGTFLGYIGSVVDVSERRAYEAGLRAGEEHFRTLVNAVPQLVWTCRPDGSCDFLSRQWLDYTGTSLQSQVGYAWLDSIHPEDRDRVNEAWREAARRAVNYDIEFRIRRHDGVYRWFRTRAIALRNADGEIHRWVGTDTDIEDLKTTENELRRANDDLNQFAHSASHDLQEPLRNLTIYSQLLKRRYSSELSPEGLELVDTIESAGRKMSELIHDLRLYTQAGDGPPERADAEDVLARTLEGLSMTIERCQAAITWDPLPVVSINGGQLQLVLLNLIGNALKYRNPAVAPQIHISAERHGRRWTFSVKDNGIGIDPVYHGKIFGLFRRLHGAGYPGTGLGLAICKKIIERYRGSLWVRSELDHGAEFFFTLPAVEQAEQIEEAT